MDLQSLAYALTQVVHNFGAVAVVGGALLGRWPQATAPLTRRRLAWLILAGWLVQGASGAGFGAISFAWYGQFPDIHGIAVVALLVKMACAVGGIVFAAAFLRYQAEWDERRQEAFWTVLILLGVIALTAAAFLRWFS
jgi:cytochrome bd-type quinol oxidase subunit 2